MEGANDMDPYTLKAGEGWTYRYGIEHTIKAGELHPGRGAAFMEFITRKGEEPPDHTHATEDEIFYVLDGELTFHCGGKSFDVVWDAGEDERMPHMERQTITPAYFTEAKSQTLPKHMLFTIIHGN